MAYETQLYAGGCLHTQPVHARKIKTDQLENGPVRTQKRVQQAKSQRQRTCRAPPSTAPTAPTLPPPPGPPPLRRRGRRGVQCLPFTASACSVAAAAAAAAARRRQCRRCSARHVAGELDGGDLAGAVRDFDSVCADAEEGGGGGADREGVGGLAIYLRPPLPPPSPRPMRPRNATACGPPLFPPHSRARRTPCRPRLSRRCCW